MHTQTQHKRCYSFEFFPPKTAEGAEKLRQTRQQLAALHPEFFSVTFGAGGSTQDHTLETVLAIRAEGHHAAPHLSCIGSTRDNIARILDEYRRHDIRHIVALRGDVPSGMVDIGHFRYAAELVEFIREQTGEHFFIEVAAYPEVHPEARSARDDLLNFKRKVDAGADSAITQYFYNADAYFQFMDECQTLGINVPVVPGIMPVTNAKQIIRICQLSGTKLPPQFRAMVEKFADKPEALKQAGIAYATGQIIDLIANGFDNVHIYTMNKPEIFAGIMNNLGEIVDK